VNSRMSWLLVRLFQSCEQPHFRLSNYRINNQYGRLHKNHRPDSHFCDSAKANWIALVIFLEPRRPSQKADIGGYYKPGDSKANAALSPSTTLNVI